MVACALAYPADKSDLLDAYLRFYAVECRPFGTPYRIMFLAVALRLLTSVWIIFVNRRFRYFVTVPLLCTRAKLQLY